MESIKAPEELRCMNDAFIEIMVSTIYGNVHTYNLRKVNMESIERRLPIPVAMTQLFLFRSIKLKSYLTNGTKFTLSLLILLLQNNFILNSVNSSADHHHDNVSVSPRPKLLYSRGSE